MTRGARFGTLFFTAARITPVAAELTLLCHLVSFRYVIRWGRVASSPRVFLRYSSYSEK
jgi:hypothetical protein